MRAEADARRAAKEAAIRAKEEAEEAERLRVAEAVARQNAIDAKAAEEARIRKLEEEEEARRLAEEAEKAAIRAKEDARIDALAERFYMGSPDPQNVPEVRARESAQRSLRQDITYPPHSVTALSSHPLLPLR